MAMRECDHGLTDDCDMTYRMLTEDFIRGKKSTVVGYWCKTHNKHGKCEYTEPARVMDLKKYEETTEPF